jgi:hypothetical protein
MSTKRRSGEARNKSEYEVGYGRPPNRTKFKPGQSGNPSGLPKKLRRRSIHREVQEVFLRPVRIRQGKGTRKVPGIIGLIERAMADALTGDKRATQFCYRIAESFGVFQIKDEINIDFSKLTEEEKAICMQGMQILNRAGMLFRYETRK